jgi:hypothetical protein
MGDASVGGISVGGRGVCVGGRGVSVGVVVGVAVSVAVNSARGVFVGVAVTDADPRRFVEQPRSTSDARTIRLVSNATLLIIKKASSLNLGRLFYPTLAWVSTGCAGVGRACCKVWSYLRWALTLAAPEDGDGLRFWRAFAPRKPVNRDEDLGSRGSDGMAAPGQLAAFFRPKKNRLKSWT